MMKSHDIELKIVERCYGYHSSPSLICAKIWPRKRTIVMQARRSIPERDNNAGFVCTMRGSIVGISTSVSQTFQDATLREIHSASFRTQ
jgi:hypothetical protein